MNWEYRNHSRCNVVLTTQIDSILQRLREGSLDIEKFLTDTRPAHQFLFRDLTPDGHKYFAGHYRGENFPILKDYQVSVQGSSTVGCSAELVAKAMSGFSQTVQKGLANLDYLHQADFSVGHKLRKSVDFSCAAFVKFTQIHPYANGNGHIARLMLVSALKRYGYSIKNFPVDPRPVDPPYTLLIREYEKGNREGLLSWIMQLLEIH